MTPADIVRSLEGCKLFTYPDPATGGKPWTIGYGHTGQGIVPGLTWTLDQAEAQLEHDLVAFGLVVDSLVQVPVTESMRSALISFAFNEGSHRLSDPACRILNHLNRGDYLTAAGQFMHWTMADGKRLLVSRRSAEIEAFLSDIVTEQGVTSGPVVAD